MKKLTLIKFEAKDPNITWYYLHIKHSTNEKVTCLELTQRQVYELLEQGFKLKINKLY